MDTEIITTDDIRAWPPLVPAARADAALGISYDTGFRLRQAGEYPLPWLAVGRLHKVRRIDLLTLLEGPLESTPSASAVPGITSVTSQMRRRAG